MARYSVAEAKNNLPKLLDRALAGEDVTITRRGEAIAKLVPERVIGAPLDLEWLDAHRVTAKAGTDLDSAALIRQMRDEGCRRRRSSDALHLAVAARASLDLATFDVVLARAAGEFGVATVDL